MDADTDTHKNTHMGTHTDTHDTKGHTETHTDTYGCTHKNTPDAEATLPTDIREQESRRKAPFQPTLESHKEIMLILMPFSLFGKTSPRFE